jgi:hypothetical protein
MFIIYILLHDIAGIFLKMELNTIIIAITHIDFQTFVYFFNAYGYLKKIKMSTAMSAETAKRKTSTFLQH